MRESLSGNESKTMGILLMMLAGWPGGLLKFRRISPIRALVSWYSSHEKDANGRSITAIYLADLQLVD
jgi:hypothetical protein